MRCFEYPVLSLISDNYSGVSMSTFLSPKTFPSFDTLLSSGVSQSPDAPLCLTSSSISSLVIKPPLLNRGHVCQDHLQEDHLGFLRSVRLRPQPQPGLWPREVTQHHQEQPRRPQILAIQQRLQQPRQPRIHLLQLHCQVRGGQKCQNKVFYEHSAFSTSSAYSAISSAKSTVVLRKALCIG